VKGENMDLKCKCGEILEEGFMGCLWCPKCEENWEIPEDQIDNDAYYLTITPLA